MAGALVIVGAGPMGREAYAYASDVLAQGDAYDFDRIAGFIDLGPNPGEHLSAFNLDIGFVNSLGSHLYKDDYVYVIAIGNCAEKRRVSALLPHDIRLANVIHPTAYVALSARLGKGIIMAPFTFVGIDSTVGDHVTLNAYASVGHDASVGDCCVMSPYSAITGRVVLEDGVFLGTHVGVVPDVRIGKWSRIAAGAAVHGDVPAGSLMVGNPAKGRVMYRIDGA